MLSKEGGRKMKTTIIALSATALIAAAPTELAHNVSNKIPDQRYHASKKSTLGSSQSTL
jgi:hypothetical protein